MPKVSIVIPNFNHAKFLKQRITSVLEQTFQDFELILLDDCSTDKSSEILQQYANHPKVIKLIVNQINSGSTFKQWQKGIRETTGEYIWIAESDDYADNHFLEILVPLLEQHTKVGLAYCQSYQVDEYGTIIQSCKDIYASIPCRQVHNGTQVVKQYMAGANLIPNASAVLFRKEIASLLDNTYTHFKLSGDWWFWCEMLLRSDIIHVCEELNYFRIHQNKVTVSASKKGLYFIEGLQILALIKQKANLSEQVYNNKSKNYANTFIRQQTKSSGEPGLPIRVVAKIMWESVFINRVFIKKIIHLFIRDRLHILKFIR
jgi:glycosyltransferase involved in cell wall biosynthesis